MDQPCARRGGRLARRAVKPEDIADRVRELSRLRARQAEIRAELVSFAIACGIPQEQAARLDVAQFFDGYLLALGHVQKWRRRA